MLLALLLAVASPAAAQEEERTYDFDAEDVIICWEPVVVVRREPGWIRIHGEQSLIRAPLHWIRELTESVESL